LAASVVVLLAAALVPTRWSAWAGWIGDRADMLIAPVEQPVHSLAGWLRPRRDARPEDVVKLEREIDLWKQRFLRLSAEHDELKDKVEKQFGAGALYSELPPKQMLRPVIGLSSDPGGQLTIRAGTRDGVELNAIATTEGVQLVGKVVKVASRICFVRLITDLSAGSIDGVIMSSDTVLGPACKALHPVTGRKLQGRVRIEGNQAPPAIGQVVRLTDDRWPRSARMLVIGTISEQPTLEPATGWYLITVRPTVELERLAEVLLRFSPSEPDSKTGSTDGGNP